MRDFIKIGFAASVLIMFTVMLVREANLYDKEYDEVMIELQNYSVRIDDDAEVHIDGNRVDYGYVALKDIDLGTFFQIKPSHNNKCYLKYSRLRKYSDGTLISTSILGNPSVVYVPHTYIIKRFDD